MVSISFKSCYRNARCWGLEARSLFWRRGLWSGVPHQSDMKRQWMFNIWTSERLAAFQLYLLLHVVCCLQQSSPWKQYSVSLDFTLHSLPSWGDWQSSQWEVILSRCPNNQDKFSIIWKSSMCRKKTEPVPGEEVKVGGYTHPSFTVLFPSFSRERPPEALYLKGLCPLMILLLLLICSVRFFSLTRLDRN